MDQLTCVACDALKPRADFYANDRKCKECRKAMVRLAREKNADHYKQYDKARANRPDRVAARAEYAQTDAGKQARIRARHKWQAANAKQKAAHDAVSRAVRTGRLVKQPCFICGADNVEAHHPGYDSPLAVVWLCVDHHKELHAEFPRAA
jgi:hypothetical protein